jgi:hypothetical protein
MTPIEAAKLDRREFRRYLQAVETEAALQRGDPPPSALGRIFKPAATERKLVLFTLGIIVILLIVAVFVIEMWGDGTPSVTTPLVTLAGTGLGFIGGMVADRKPTTPGEERTPGAPPPGGTPVFVEPLPVEPLPVEPLPVEPDVVEPGAVDEGAVTPGEPGGSV